MSPYALTIDGTNQLSGWAGTATYTGNQGFVDGCRGIFVESYTAGTVVVGTTPSGNNNQTWINTNGASFSQVGGGGGSTNVCTTQTADILAFWDETGSGGTIQAGDPYVLYSSQSSSTTPNLTITLTDSQTWP